MRHPAEHLCGLSCRDLLTQVFNFLPGCEEITRIAEFRQNDQLGVYTINKPFDHPEILSDVAQDRSELDESYPHMHAPFQYGRTLCFPGEFVKFRKKESHGPSTMAFPVSVFDGQESANPVRT